MDRRPFEEEIDVILEDISFDSATAAADQVEAAKMAADDAAKELRKEIELLNMKLATEIRVGDPRLKVTLGRGNCTVRYRDYNNCLNFSADPKSQCFKCGMSPFERRFCRYHGHTLDNPEVLPGAIISFFKQQYGSMR